MAGGLGSIVDGGAAAGGRTLGAGMVVYTAYRLFVFICNFLAGRYDARQKRLDDLDERLAVSLGKRLTHLEEAESRNQNRIRLLEEAVAILTTELRNENPSNTKLKVVGRMLNNVHPVMPSDPKLDELMRHATRAVDDEEDGA